MHHYYTIHNAITFDSVYSMMLNDVSHDNLMSTLAAYYQDLRYPQNLLATVDAHLEPNYSAALHSMMTALWAKSRHRLLLKAQLAPQIITSVLLVKMLNRLAYATLPDIVTVETYGSRHNDPQHFSNVVSEQTLELLYPARPGDHADTL